MLLPPRTLPVHSSGPVRTTPLMIASGPALRRSSFGYTLAAITVTGLFLRYYDLRHQIPVDDEWHALKRAAIYPSGTWSGTTSGARTAIPVNLYLGWVLRTFGWSEI